MKLAERIAAKRRERERLFFDVDEWGEEGEPTRLYFNEVSARDIEKVSRKHPNFTTNTSLSAMVDLIVLKAQDEAGDAVFTVEDKPVLMGESSLIIAEIFAAIFSAKSIEDHEKN